MHLMHSTGISFSLRNRSLLYEWSESGHQSDEDYTSCDKIGLSALIIRTDVLVNIASDLLKEIPEKEHPCLDLL